MDFPHLNDTDFPNLNNVDAYGYKNNFDYTRWVPNTHIHLTNVRWNGDYADCVKFDSDEERDAWFDKKIQDESVDAPDTSIELKTNTTLLNGTIKVPLPYDRASQFNYLVVDVPVVTSSDNKLDYETSNGYRRWHFFISGFDTNAPSVTSLNLTLDIWTQYINTVGINYMMLERGHAPVAATDTDKYLANPIDNCEYLLCPDVNYGGDTVARGGKFIPFGNGEKYICLASTCTVSQVSKVGTVSEGESYQWGEPSFYDESAYPDSSNRWGYQYGVSGYTFGNGKSYANTTTPAGNALSNNGRIPNNVTVYAIKAAEADSFVNDCMVKQPTFLKTVESCFMVAAEMITLGTSIKLAGHTLHVCEGNEFDLNSIELSREMFDIPEKYQRFTKLYTFPYSELEITDNDGKSVTVRVEETSDIKAHGIASVAYPYLNMRMFLTGIGGVGSNTYQWQDLRGSHDLEMTNADWYKFCYDMDIPMYSLYMDGQTSWEITNYNRSVSNARNSALTSYHNTVREANNAKNNAVDTARTAYDNAVATANTAQSNANNGANTNRTNAYNDADTTDTNNANNRACASDVTANNNANMTANTALDNDFQRQQTDVTNKRGHNKMLYGNALAYQTSLEENQVTTSQASADSYASMWGAVGNIAASAALGAAGGSIVPGAGTAGGAILGAAMGLVQNAGSLVSAGNATTNASIIVNCNNEVTALNNEYNLKCDGNDQTSNNNGYLYSVQHNNGVNTNNVNTNTSNTDRNNQCNASNTANATSTMRTNATNTRDMLVTNAANTRNTSVANAGRTQSNTVSNATWTDRTSVTAAQDVLRNAQNNAKASSSDSANANPVKLCVSGGDYAPDYMRTRGVQIKCRTQSDYAIRAAGDEFARFGYKLNQVWEVSELKLMKHYTYWKARDCWVYDERGSNDAAQRAIGAIFEQGVTVWNDPEEIGKVNPYDN